MRLFTAVIVFLLLLGAAGCSTTGGGEPESYQFGPVPRAGASGKALGPPPKRRPIAEALPAGWPVDHPERRVISPYGVSRGRSRLHRGMDIKAPRGVPVLSTAPGTVHFAGAMRGYGKLVMVDHGGGVKTAYGHLDRIHVRVGEQLDNRQPVGSLGATGNASTHHVHYEVRVDGKFIDPTPSMALSPQAGN